MSNHTTTAPATIAIRWTYEPECNTFHAVSDRLVTIVSAALQGADQMFGVWKPLASYEGLAQRIIADVPYGADYEDSEGVLTIAAL